MGDHVGHSRGGLAGGQAEGQLRVEEGDGRAVEVRVNAAFEVLLVVADNAGVRGLGTGCGDGHHAGDVDAVGGNGALAEEVPYVAVVYRPVRWPSRSP